MSAARTAGFVEPATQTRPVRHLFLSPHYDDIALSCGGTALLLSRAGRLPTVALLFGAAPDPAQPLTSFAQSQHEGWRLDAAGVIAARRAEEAAAAAILGTKVRFMPFHDAIYRNGWYTSNDLLFAAPVPAEAGLPAEIVAALRLPGTPDAATRLYAPLAVGSHVDHLHTVAAGVLLGRAGWDVWFYEDQPYALRDGAVEEWIGRFGERLVEAARVPVGAVWEEKVDAIFSYPSQLATVFSYVGAGAGRDEISTLMRRYARALGGDRPAERFWRLA